MNIRNLSIGSKGRLPVRFSVKMVVSLAAIIFLVSGWAWWNHVQNSPDRVFWGMVGNSLSTSAFSRTVVQAEGSQSLSQTVAVRTSPHHLANSRSVITQGEPATTRVVTDSIGTPMRDYVRYADIQTDQKGASGNALDFSSIENVWGMAETQGTGTNGQLYNESVLGVIPFGNLSKSQQAALIKQMKESNAYKFELLSTERSGWWRRPRHTFSVQVNPAAYIAVLKTFAKDMGLTHLESIDPSQYQSTQPVTVAVTVDGWSRQLAEVSYGSGSRVEKFSSFGSIKPLQSPPAESIPISELQTRLQTVQ